MIPIGFSSWIRLNLLSMQVLLVEDDAAVRKMTTAAHGLLDCLRDVGGATDMPSLLKAFQAFSKSLLLLHNLVMDRVKDLRDHRQQDCMKTSVEMLRKSVSMLHTAMYTAIKHPTSEVAQESKNYILQLVDSTIHDMVMMLKGSYPCMSTGWCGYYTERRVRLLKLLSDPAFVSVKDSNFDVVLRDLVFHSLAVANSSQREMRSCLTANCKLVLQLWSEISQHIRWIKINGPEEQEPNDHQEKLCVSLMLQIHELDEAVVKASLRQVIHTFVLTSGPLEQLVNTVHNFLDADLEDSLDLDRLQALFKTFVSCADRMAEVAGFISALAVDEKSLASVENTISCLLRLKDGVVPLLLELEGDSVQYHGALHKLINFHQKWREETEELLNAFCEVINVKDFIHLSCQEMKTDLDAVVEAHKSRDWNLLRNRVQIVMDRMSQIVQIVRKRVDKSDDPIYRNGLLVLVKQAENSAADVTDIFNTNFQEDEAFLLLAKSITVAIKNFDVLHEGLDGLQHPHLLSPLREGARQVAVTPLVSHTEETKKTTIDQSKTSGKGDETEEDLPLKLKATEKKNSELAPVHQSETREIKKPFFIDSNSLQTSHSSDLLPLLYEVVNMSKAKNVEALSIACTQIMELCDCYAQATKEAASIMEENDHQKMETLRSELVTLTPLLVQAAQETAMSSVKILDTVYKHSAQFSDLIKDTHRVLLPVTGMWYHAIKATTKCQTVNMADSCIQELTEIMGLCADTVELVTSTDIKLRRGDSNDSITSLFTKLQKAQTNTKNLTDLLASKTSHADALDGPCMLWALSIQVLLTSLDRILGTGSTHGRRQLSQQMTPQKRLAAMSENSLRIQEAARLSSLNCRDNCKVKILKEGDDVKALSEVFLQATEDLTVSRPGVLRLARTEFLQRQLQIKMKSLCCLLSKVNEDYVTAIQNAVSLAWSAGVSDEAEEIHTRFEATSEFLLRSVKTATESVQDCLNFMRDPRERSNLRFISDHLSFQMSEIVTRAKSIMETQNVSETLSIDIQTQCWSAKAHYLVEELYKVDGIYLITKEQIKLGLQGKAYSGVLQTDIKPSSVTKETEPRGQTTSEKPNPVSIPPKNSQGLKTATHSHVTQDLLSHSGVRVPAFSSVDPTLTYTSLFLKQEADKWDVHGNQIVKVTKEMADKIYDMTRYLKRKGPIQVKKKNNNDSMIIS